MCFENLIKLPDNHGLQGRHRLHHSNLNFVLQLFSVYIFKVCASEKASLQIQIICSYEMLSLKFSHCFAIFSFLDFPERVIISIFQLGEAELEAFEGLTDSKGVVTKELFCQFAKVGLLGGWPMSRVGRNINQ